MGGGGGRWEAEGGPKQPFRLKRAVLYLQSVAQIVTMHKGGQDWQEGEPGTPSRPSDAPQGHEMHPRGFTASIKSRL